MFSWDTLQYFHFLRPLWLLLFIPFAFFIIVQIRRADMLGQWRSHIASHLLPLMIVPGNRRRLFNPIVFFILFGLMVTLGLAGPSWERKASPFAEDNAALVIALDLSSSMGQSDIAPTRIMRAKQKIMDLMDLRGDAYTSLVVYAGSAHTVIAMCNDRQVINHFLDALDTDLLPKQGKAPETVLTVVDSIMADSPLPATVLFITDGATELSVPVFKEYFSSRPHKAIFWGIGKTAEQLQGEQIEAAESSIIAMQTGLLKQLAQASNGSVELLSNDKSDVEGIYKQVDSAFIMADDETRPWVDAGYYCLFPMIGFFLLWFRKGWSLQW